MLSMHALVDEEKDEAVWERLEITSFPSPLLVNDAGIIVGAGGAAGGANLAALLRRA